MGPDAPQRHARPARAGRLPVRALIVLVALAGTACAGGVGKYRNAAAGYGGPTALPGAPAAAAGTGQGALAAADGSSPAAVTDTTIPAGSPAVKVLTGAVASSVTPASGPAARFSRASGATAATTDAGPSGSSGAAGVPPPSAAGTGSGPAGPATGGGPGTSATVPTPVPGAGTTIGITKDTITLGVVYPKSGAYTGLFRNVPAVVQAAADEAGLINGRRLVVKYYDDGTANAGTIQVEEKRAKDEVFSLMSIISESNVVLAPLANQHKIPIVVGNIDRKVAEPLTYAFPVFVYWSRAAAVLPSFIKNTLEAGARKIGVVYEGTSTAIDAKNVFKERAKELGLNVIFEQPIAQNQSTCANEVSNLQAHGVELVYMMNGPLGAVCMLRDAKALGYKPMWTGVGASWNANVVATASGGGADGIRTLATGTTLETPAGRHYAELMRKAAPDSGADTDDIMLLEYALMRSTIEGLRRTGPDLTREGLVQTWETRMNDFDSGYLPPPTFGPGNRSGPLLVGVTACCTNGQWTSPQIGWRAAF
ncbi:MAG: branched-chain amino acid transport system substrate-binding protein [Actinomycetota bacterium]|jgi:ABC-type branched-subunit amino acid transport system substrate-binding protein|nr:branched-chain amino acid transport system substrate-binding protein [Actinomycetota bacterium]